MIWRPKMALLTTLAALVIIAHCVEEDMETAYRHELRPRFLDTSNNDQPWRAIEEEPEIKKPRLPENWDDSLPDAGPKRRRPGRKRKRRPQIEPTEEPQGLAYPEQPPRPYYDVDIENSRQATEKPKRRRKTPETRPVRWTDDDIMIVERPLRNNGGRRKKRPSLDTWPEMSEFKHIDNTNQEDEETEPEVDPHKVIAEKVFGHNRDVEEHKAPDTEEHRDSIAIADIEDIEQTSKDPVTADKSLSEFSLELVSKPKTNMDHESDNYESRIHIPETKLSEKTETEIHELEDQKPKKHEPILRIRKIKKKKERTEDKEQYKSTEKVDLLQFLYRKKTSGLGKATTLQNNKKHDDIPNAAIMELLKSGLKAYFLRVNENNLRQLYTDKQILVQSKSEAKVSNNAYNITDKVIEPALDFWATQILTDTTNKADEISLKDILKRSNGTSLSEILQQHNLSLSDLLRGKEHAVSILKHKSTLTNKFSDKKTIKIDSNEQPLITSETKYSTEPVIEYFTTTEAVQTETIQTEIVQTEAVQTEAVQTEAVQTEAVQTEAVPTEAVQTETPVETTQTTTVMPLNDVTRMSTSRRYLIGLRKKLRMRPVLNTTNTNTFKGQLSRDIVALNSRKYTNFRRNRTKTKLWTDVFPSVTQNNTYKENNNNNKPVQHQRIIVNVPGETTTSTEVTSRNNSYEDRHPQVNIEFKLDDIDMDVTESLVESVTEITTETTKIVPEKSVGIVTMPRPTAISSGLRQQALNNRLKRKRLKNKNSTTEPPQDDIIKHLFGMSNLVSSSEFIARTQEPRTTEPDSTELTTLNDFLTTERTKRTKGHIRTTTTQTTTPKLIMETTTKETAKYEIEEIFNDTESRAKLSRILKERNMTLTELVELRERGSSHVHLADIFHNASKEPNPAEPFLSKSLLEPISKETYPLRAILEANLHEPNGRVMTIDSNSLNSINIPVVMDFGNNVNENAENMGIMSLFNNFTKNTTKSTTSTENEIKNLTVPEMASNMTNRNQTVRESRVLDDIKDDVVSWNEIFSMMGKSHNSGNEETSTNQPFKKITIEEDADGDGLIVLEDLQRLTDFDSNIALVSKEKLDVKPDSVDKGSGINDHMTNHTKSITVATASIAGLVMVLFLLTYVTFKWRQQRSMARKRSFCDERIPTPVFEARKGNKNNNSTRSISPMLQTSNIYTLNTLDSQNGKESPDYMWDSLRKPFQ